jgi:ABC-type spermidine/putrescine transport system permease subunit II
VDLRHASRRRNVGLVLAVFCGCVFTFLVAPCLIVAPMAFSSSAFLGFPPPGFSLQWFREYFSDPQWQGATWRSLRVALVVMVVATAVGTMLALGLSRCRGWTRTALNALIVSPMVLPVIIYAVAIYGLYTQLRLMGTDLGLILAHAVLAVPLVFLTVGATLSRHDVSMAQAAASCGANGWRTFWLVTLPLIKPGVVAGALFAFITSFDEVVVAVFIGGLESTLPKKMFDDIRWDIKPVVAAIATLLIGVTVLVLLLAGQSRRILVAGSGREER